MACDALLVAGASLSFPFMAVYLTVHRGLPAGWVGAFLSASMLLAAAGQGIGGELSDAVGRKRVMLGALIGRALTTLVMAWVVWSRAPVAFVMLLHVLGLFSGTFFGPASRSWVADACPPARRVEAYGLLRMGSNFGWAIGPAVGGLLALKSYPLLFLITAAAFAGSAAIVWLGVAEAPRSGGARRPSFKAALETLRDPRFARLCLATLLIAAVMSQLVVSLSLHCVRSVGMPESRVGLLFSLNGALVVLLQYWAAKLLERRPLTAGLTAGCLLYATGYLGIGFATTFQAAAAAMAVVTLGEIMVAPTMQTLAANVAPASRKGRYLGVHGILQHAGSALGIMLGGLGNQHVSPLWAPGPWCGVGLIAVSAGIVFASLRKSLSPEENGGLREEEAAGTLGP